MPKAKDLEPKKAALTETEIWECLIDNLRGAVDDCEIIARQLTITVRAVIRGITRRYTRPAKLKSSCGQMTAATPGAGGAGTTRVPLLTTVNTVGVNITTAEDPVEITQPGLRQVQVNPKIDWTFAKALRALLRADPDVIMVGEMRDTETARTAIEASLTGHLVLSTLHTNSAPETVTRLLDMGCDPFSFADAMLGVLAQRLARRICKDCKEQYVGTKEEYEELRQGYGPDYWDSEGNMTRDFLPPSRDYRP